MFYVSFHVHGDCHSPPKKEKEKVDSSGEIPFDVTRHYRHSETMLNWVSSLLFLNVLQPSGVDAVYLVLQFAYFCFSLLQSWPCFESFSTFLCACHFSSKHWCKFITMKEKLPILAPPHLKSSQGFAVVCVLVYGKSF